MGLLSPSFFNRRVSAHFLRRAGAFAGLIFGDPGTKNKIKRNDGLITRFMTGLESGVVSIPADLIAENKAMSLIAEVIRSGVAGAKAR